jgi:hypothetical protein
LSAQRRCPHLASDPVLQRSDDRLQPVHSRALGQSTLSGTGAIASRPAITCDVASPHH